jgi:phosphotransferase system HPr (HPr) family protein
MVRLREHSVEVTINNPLGFHVRPVQRFASLALLFKSDVQVHLRSRTVPGKSVMNLVSLGGRHGEVMRITARGEDARQCVEVLTFLAESSFFVEDSLDTAAQPNRHVERLTAIASCFKSDITAVFDGKTADAKKSKALSVLGLTPTSVPEFEIRGPDAVQARAVLENLVASCFYVEDKMIERARKAT